MSKQKLFATAITKALSDAVFKSDGRVIAVFLQLAASPRIFASDLAGVLGFSDEDVDKYLGALGDLIRLDDTVYSLSPVGIRVISYARAGMTAPAIKTLKPLTSKQMERWEEIKRRVMDTTPGYSPFMPLREAMAFYFAKGGISSRNSDKNYELRVGFKRQGLDGISFHLPGTIPPYDFKSLIYSFRLKSTDESIIERALAAGHTFW